MAGSRVLSIPRLPETWCVVTETGMRFIVDYSGNGGFGPVSVSENGRYVPIRYRHRFRDISDGQDYRSPRTGDPCPVCVDPNVANTYLPSVRWSTPDLNANAEPGSGNPDRGEFTAHFLGGPDYVGRFIAEVSREDWWHRWIPYAVVELDPQGNWRSAFDTWRALATGYTVEPALT